MQDKNVLITGVAGLLGSRLADWIIENTDYNVIGIDDLSGGYLDNVHNDVKLYTNDLATEDIEHIFDFHDIEYVFHFAAYAAEGLSPFIRTFNYDNNLKATARVVNECIKADVKRLVFTSTLAVYGHGEGGIFDENQQQAPIDPYGVAKYACEMDIQIANEQHGLDYCIIRPHNVYGVKQNIWDKYRNVLGIWMYQYLKHKPLTIFGDGEQTRAFSFIDDSLEPLWNAAVRDEASCQIINLGGIKSYPITEAAETLVEVIKEEEGDLNDFDIPIQYLEGRHEVKHAIPTWQKSIDILGFEHKTDLKEGLRQMWRWVRTQPMRDQFVWPSYELDQGIYSFWK
tara:strand:- start:934 stop:1956 length:1023 start_codon:yes stop_codon:yes gene_type:complete